MNKLIYGTIVSAFLATGAAIYYIDAGPESGQPIRQPDLSEVHEGLLERLAAVGSWPFTVSIVTNVGQTDGGVAYVGIYTNAEKWSFMGSTVPLIGSAPSRGFIIRDLQEIENIIGSFVEAVSNGVPVYWTGSNLWDALNVADGVFPNWTVAISNGTPIYGPSTNLQFGAQNSVLYEAYKVLAKLDTTARDASWYSGPTYSYGRTTYWWLYDNGEPYILPKWETPVWWTNAAGYQWRLSTNAGWTPYVDASLDPARIVYVTNGTGTGAAYEEITMESPAAASGQAGTWAQDPDYQLFIVPSAEAAESAAKLCTSGGVWIANLASGVTCEVSIPWSLTGSVTSVSSGSTGYVVSGIITGATVATITCTGLSTSYVSSVWATGYEGGLTNIVGPLDELAAAFGEWAVAPYAGEYEHSPPPEITGRSDATIGTAILRWTFIKCVP